MKKTELPKLTPPEFEIMDAVWRGGEVTATEILNSVNAGKSRKLKRTTIQVQVARLEEKGWIAHRSDGNKFLFSSTVLRREASAAIVRDVSERVFGGSCVELVKSLFTSSDISPEEIRKLREFIDRYEE